MAELPVLQLDPVVFGRHSHAGKPDVKESNCRRQVAAMTHSCEVLQSTKKVQTTALKLHSHLRLISSILSVGTIMFPNSSTFWKDWNILTCCGISSKQTCRSSGGKYITEHVVVCAQMQVIYISDKQEKHPSLHNLPLISFHI